MIKVTYPLLLTQYSQATNFAANSRINPKKSLDFFELRFTIENESNISSKQCKEIVYFQCQV